MRKTIAKVLIMALMMSAFCLTALAAFEGAAPEDIAILSTRATVTLRRDMTEPYGFVQPGTPVGMYYATSNVVASTRISVSIDATAYSYVFVKGLQGSTDYSYGITASGGYVNSGTAFIGELYSYENTHSGYRTISGQTTSWAYKVVPPS